jgi:hypothetical protein
MALFSIPTPHPGRGFFLLPAEPSILSTTRPSLRSYQRSRTGRARSQLMATKSSCTLTVGDADRDDLHHRMGAWGSGHRHAEGVGCECQHHVRELCRDARRMAINDRVGRGGINDNRSGTGAPRPGCGDGYPGCRAGERAADGRHGDRPGRNREPPDYRCAPIVAHGARIECDANRQPGWGHGRIFAWGGTRLQSGKFPHRQSVCRRQPPPQTRGVPELGNRPGSTVVRRSGSIGISLNPGHLG